MRRHRRLARRRRSLGGKWADAHQGFPWYGIGWGWHVFLIWPALGWLVTAPIRAVMFARWTQQETQHG